MRLHWNCAGGQHLACGGAALDLWWGTLGLRWSRTGASLHPRKCMDTANGDSTIRIFKLFQNASKGNLSNKRGNFLMFKGAPSSRKCGSDDLEPMGSMAGLQYGSLSGHAGSVSSEWSATRMQYFIVWPESPPRADEPGRFQLHKVYKLG